MAEPTGIRAAKWLREVADLLEQKCDSYGDSIGNPVRVFSSSDKDEGIRVRIDDKLSRIKHGKGFPGDDNLKDLCGYVALLAVSKPGPVRIAVGVHRFGSPYKPCDDICTKPGCNAYWTESTLKWDRECISKD